MPDHADTLPAVNGERLLQDLASFAEFGGRADGGVDRVAGSCEDLEAREWLQGKISEAGLVPRMDEIGNVFGRTPKAEHPRMLTGSHTDTVPAGGRLDGAYGVIAALEALRSLHEAGHHVANHVEIVGFWDEEGVRDPSTGGLVGSTYFCEKEYVRNYQSFLELHIEQGATLEKAAVPLAVVGGIVGIERFVVEVTGEANHAGTTAMEDRADAGHAAATIASRVRGAAMACSDRLRMNVGSIEYSPGAPNVVPGKARLLIEIRDPSDEVLRAAENHIRAVADEVAAGERCHAAVERASRKPPVAFDGKVLQSLRDALDRCGAEYLDTVSYAGHDANVISQRIPTGMLFVPSRNGVSHAPSESTSDEHLILGCQALLNSLVQMYSISS
ncbi:M20 family metallo-hydrolase [Streptomyces reniochalinae]|uniref:Zn-dependent hydrolase n=1 Tax=Streptomyces reniochalinae TaxID=2250578 RepID=A0A367E8B6_9ACTN|nr:M20 family metallo-hydrolase [Streptomyces reniochalinae]RCG13617.1 Zn-dependent hydrolase [Streptomyces reniochalinae]